MRIFHPRQPQWHSAGDPCDTDSDLEPLAPTAGAKRGLDRRQVCLRWLSGSLLTGLFSIGLFSGALYASLNGLYNFASAPRMVENQGVLDLDDDTPVKEDRLSFQTAVNATSRSVIQETDVRLIDGKERIVSKPYVYMQMPLATATPLDDAAIPSFNPLKLFAEAANPEPQQAAEAEKPSLLKTEMVPLNPLLADISRKLQASPDLIQQDLAEIDLFSSLSDFSEEEDTGEEAADAGFEDVAGLLPTSASLSTPAIGDGEELFDAASFGRKSQLSAVSVESRFRESLETQVFEITNQDDIRLSLERANVPVEEIERLLSRLSESLAEMPASSAKVAYYENNQVGGVRHVARLELNAQDTQVARLIRLSSGEFMPLSLSQANVMPALIRGGLRRANLYESLYQTGLDNGLPQDVIQDFIRMHAFNVDFNKPVQPQDHIELFFEPKGGPDGTPDKLLFASLTFGGETMRLYRFRTPDDGKLDYYDEQGRSARKFLLRKPLERGVFRSGYGMRAHPILRNRRMHEGVDWAAPTGSPIVAAGNGIVQEAKWRSGYGRWVQIKHANGYATGYAHMSNFGPGIAPGVEVKMGQVIGYVGSTGRSTGPHLHYEVTVNGRNVDPMRIRVPRERSLQGRALSVFEKEKARIHALMAQSNPAVAQYASR